MAINKKTNGYKVDVSLGIDPITKKQRRIRVSGKKVRTKQQAQKLEAKYLRLHHENKLDTPSNLSLTDIYEFYEERHTKNLKPSYIKSQERIFKVYVEPHFKDTAISKIKFIQIRDFQNHLLSLKGEKKNRLSHNTINMIILHVSKLFQIAIREGFTNSNPCLRIEKLKIQKKDMSFWTVEEFKIFLSGIDKEDKPFLSLFYQVAFLTGMRAGEMIALSWNDIDFTRSEIRVNKSATQIKGEYVTTEPKTKNSNRYITINKNLLAALNDWKNKQQQYLIDHFQSFDSEKLLVFQYSEKHPSSGFFSKQIKKIILQNELDIKPIRLHDLRHSHVALLIHNNEEPTKIKQRLGHASITTTIDTYGHLYPNAQRSMSDKLDDII